jgi:hypothetical protein
MRTTAQPKSAKVATTGKIPHVTRCRCTKNVALATARTRRSLLASAVGVPWSAPASATTSTAAAARPSTMRKRAQQHGQQDAQEQHFDQQLHWQQLSVFATPKVATKSVIIKM